jgi:hypothetical protein
MITIEEAFTILGEDVKICKRRISPMKTKPGESQGQSKIQTYEVGNFLRNCSNVIFGDEKRKYTILGKDEIIDIEKFSDEDKEFIIRKLKEVENDNNKYPDFEEFECQSYKNSVIGYILSNTGPDRDLAKGVVIKALEKNNTNFDKYGTGDQKRKCENVIYKNEDGIKYVRDTAPELIDIKILPLHEKEFIIKKLKERKKGEKQPRFTEEECRNNRDKIISYILYISLDPVGKSHRKARLADRRKAISGGDSTRTVDSAWE